MNYLLYYASIITKYWNEEDKFGENICCWLLCLLFCTQCCSTGRSRFAFWIIFCSFLWNLCNFFFYHKSRLGLIFVLGFSFFCLLLFLPSNIVGHLDRVSSSYTYSAVDIHRMSPLPPHDRQWVTLDKSVVSIWITDQSQRLTLLGHRAHVVSLGSAQGESQGESSWLLSEKGKGSDSFSLRDKGLTFTFGESWFDFNRALICWTITGKSRAWKGVGSMEKWLLKL